VVISIVVALCFVGIGWALSQTRDTTKPPVYKDPAVQQLFPNPGDLVLRQSRIGATLAPSYTGSLVVDGIPIPDDQSQRVAGLNQIFFTPGPGTVTGALSPGRHCAAVNLWLITQSPRQGRSLGWCFGVH
jgi:hypothetical protein